MDNTVESGIGEVLDQTDTIELLVQLMGCVVTEYGFRDQGLRCKALGMRKEEDCHICKRALLMCRVFGGQCRSNKCRDVRILNG
jgi:hypothetical protein